MPRGILRTDKISLRFVACEDKIVLSQLKGPCNIEYGNLATYRRADMERYQFDLSALLRDYQKQPGPASLENLVREASRAYRAFLVEFSDDSAKDWWRRTVKNRGSINAPILELMVLDTLTIPFGLYFVDDPDEIKDWSNYEDIVRGFIGVDFAIHKIYQRQKRLQNAISSLCGNLMQPRIVHSIDQQLPHAIREALNWTAIDGQVSTPKKKAKLIDEWTNLAVPPHLVHLSCHAAKGADGRQYMSVGKGEHLHVDEVRNRDVTMPYPPFVFLNSCEGGLIDTSSRDNFVFALFPRVAVGFIATTSKVSDELAEQMAKAFYRNFHAGAEVLLALHEAIRTVVVDKGRLGGLAYVLWESDPHLTLRQY